MPNSNDFLAGHTENILKNTSLIIGKLNFSAEMAASKSGSTPSEAQPSSNTSKNTENSLIKHQGQKWQQVFDFDKMLKQLRSSTSEKQHHRSKNDTSSSSKSSSSNSSSQSSKSGSSSNSKNGRSIRQVQRLNGNDMHYYGIAPKKASAGVIVCSICRGIYTMVGFSNHMIMQHPTAWGAISSKLTLTTSNEMFNIISNDNSQDCLRDVAGSTAPTDILGSPSDLSGIMSTSSNASSSSSSISTTSSTYAATPRHKSSKSSGGTTAGSSSSGGSSSTSGSRSRSKQSRHGSNNNNHHTASVGIHTSGSAAGAENTQAQSKSSKKSNNSNSSSSSNANTNSKTENTSNAPTLVATTASSTVNATLVTNSGKNSKESAASLVDTVVTTPIAIYSSSSNSSCSLPPTPKLSTPLTEVKSPAFVAQESAESSVSSSSIDFERLTSTGKSLSAKLATNASGKTTKTIASISSTLASRDSSKAAVSKEMSRFEPARLTELDHAVSSITENTTKLADKKVDVSIKNIMEGNANIVAAGTNNIFQIPTTTIIADNSKEKLQTVSMMPTSSNNNNMNVQTVLPANYVVSQDVVQNCEEPLPHNASDDNSILTFDDMFDSKFINEILSTADTDIQFDENELDRATVAQQQQQQQQQQQVQEQHQVYQQQVSHSAKRMRYDESLLANGQQQQQQQHILQQQQTHSSVEITGEFVTYQQQQQQQHQQQQQQYVPYNVTTLEDLKLFNSAGQLVEPHQQQMQTLLQHGTEQQQQQQQLTAIDAMQLQQLLYQQQTINSHYDTNMIDNTTDPNALALQQQQQQYDQSGVVSAKQLMEMCATVDMKPNKMSEFTAAAYDNCYDNMASHFQLCNVPSLTDDNADAVVEQVNTDNEGGMLMPNIVNGMQRGTQQYVLPGGAGEDHLIYEITDNNQVAVISQQRQQQMLNEFLTQANYEQVTTDMNVTTGPTALDATHADGATLLQPQNSGGNATMTKEESAADVDEDLLDFDYSLMETYKTLSSSGSAGGSSSSSGGSGSGSNSKAIKTEGNISASNSGKYYDDGYLNTYLYPGVPKPSAVNCFGLVKLPFAAATTFRKHILNARKANNSPITLSGGGGINGIVCSNSSTSARLTSNTKSMQNYFSNLTSTSNSLGGNEFSIGSITITNSSSSQNNLYAAHQKQQNAGSNNTSGGGNSGNVEITFNTNSNGCGSAMSPVSTLQRSRTKSGNSASPAAGSVGASCGGATLVRSKSQTGAPIAIVAPTSRLPPPPRPSTAGPVLAQSNKTIFIGNNTSMNGNDRVKFIKRCMPLTNSNNTNNNSSRLDTAKRQKFSPRQIADFLGGVSNNNNNNGSKQQKPSSAQNAEVGTNGNSGNNNHDAVTNNASLTTNYNTASADDQLKLERVAHFYERRRKLYDMARNSRQQQQHHQQQRSQQQPHVQQKLLKQQQQLFKMLTDYGQLNAVVGNCKGANANTNPGSNNNSGSEVLRISV
ncbi:probable WRKY transcription factor protein 1 [Ceratitis capitata]|uniref:(Mediterranean fruit fly) hypothetical protein n=3 Tax=Ceratitis capitata TaxID=7213 RepID=A0A811UNT9_CERCA|nr:probable WRKY transcription factor protein 1 [Ceratitis capitata]XP_004523274.1 probable WRKY transcription factor protein 1 [Ceratitis capitata]CAD6999506.1 unnamed protein product [Ceratitis capitata]